MYRYTSVPRAVHLTRLVFRHLHLCQRYLLTPSSVSKPFFSVELVKREQYYTVLEVCKWVSPYAGVGLRMEERGD